jgi:hypothetical protein
MFLATHQSQEKMKDTSEAQISQENLRLMYTEAHANRRHYSALRFAAQSVFFAVLGGLASIAFQIIEIKSPSPMGIILGAKVVGLWFCIIYFWFDILGDLHLRHFSTVIASLEADLGYQQLSNRTFRRYLPQAFWFSWSLYALLIGVWGISIVLDIKMLM